MKVSTKKVARILRPTITQLHSNPRKVSFSVYHVRKKLEIKGQGTVGFSVCAKSRFRILFRSGCSSLMVDIGETRTSFRVITKGQIDTVLCEAVKKSVETDPFLDIGREQVYWLSIDKNNSLIRFGKGEMITELCELEFDYSQRLEAGEMDWVSSLDSFSIAGNFNDDEVKQISPVYRRLPVTTSAPPVIVEHNQINLGLIDSNAATVVNNLSAECAHLYNNVAGRNLSLNTPDFPDFSDAINWSIMTEGAVCHTRLREKSAGLSEERKRQCYLRITVGENLGDSPGAPYVLEIWPGQHYSPVHRHAECNAIIKVLHGSLSCRWFRSLQFEDSVPYQQAVLSAGQVTWLDPGQFQTHQLYNHNIEGNMCATIQCYKYSKIDFEHYEYFDYLNEDTREVCQFAPRSDWRYSDFKEQIRAEWDAYKRGARSNSPGRVMFTDKTGHVENWH
ncbi:MAG TPA: hypothetical protein ENJ87_08310 [Gammaproteobacteria bacterium]|nr:hypothetical protein [Gammaproteobacteria bacterium]